MVMTVLGMFVLAFLIVFCDLFDWFAAEDPSWVARVWMSSKIALERNTEHDRSKTTTNKKSSSTSNAGGRGSGGPLS